MPKLRSNAPKEGQIGSGCYIREKQRNSLCYKELRQVFQNKYL